MLLVNSNPYKVALTILIPAAVAHGYFMAAAEYVAECTDVDCVCSSTLSVGDLDVLSEVTMASVQDIYVLYRSLLPRYICPIGPIREKQLHPHGKE